MVEPIQGERGVIPATKEFLLGLRELCDKAKIPLILDEVQTGVGRTGSWWAFQSLGVKPDIITSAKGIANGLPLGACVADEPFASAFSPGDHGTTYGGGALVCAAALATFAEIEERGLLAETQRKGSLLRSQLSAIDGVAEVRGLGLMVGAVLSNPVAFKVVARALDKGVIVNATSDSVLRFVPPLVISDAAMTEAVGVIKSAIETSLREGPSLAPASQVASY